MAAQSLSEKLLSPFIGQVMAVLESKSYMWKSISSQFSLSGYEVLAKQKVMAAQSLSVKLLHWSPFIEQVMAVLASKSYMWKSISSQFSLSGYEVIAAQSLSEKLLSPFIGKAYKQSAKQK